MVTFFGSEDCAAVEACQQCFLNPEVAVALLAQPSEIPRCIHKAYNCKLSFTTTLCAVRVRQLTNLSLVAELAE